MESCNESFSSLAEDITLSLSDQLNEFLKFIEDTKPKKFYRKIRTRNGIKRRYMIRIYPIRDILLDNMYLPVKFLRHYIRSICGKI